MADKSRWSRRAVLMGAAGGAVGLASAFARDGAYGNLRGGNMALEDAFNVSGELWIGPDSAKSEVETTSGRVYMASDTQVDYYADGDGWTKMGVGSSSEPVPSVNTEDLNNAKQVPPDADFSGIQSVLGGFAASNGWNKLELHPDGEYAVDTVERLKVPSYTIIEGNGAQLVGNGDETTDAHLLLTNDDWTNGNEWIIVRDLVMDGAFTDGSGAKDSACGGMVQFTNASHVFCENLHLDRSYRHNFQFVKCLDSKIKDSVFERAHGDDPFSVSDGGSELGGTLGASVSRRIYVEGCTAKNFSSPESGFEVDDGPQYVYFDDCVSKPDATGFSVKTHPGDIAPKDIYFRDCWTANDINIRTNASTDDGLAAQRFFLDDCYIGNTLYVGAEDVFVRGGEIANSSLVSQSANTVPTVEFDDVHFSAKGSAMYGIEVRDTNRFKLHNCDMLEFGNRRGVWLHPDGVTLSDVTITDYDISHAAQDQPGIELQPINGGVIENFSIREGTFENCQNGIRVKGSASNYAGQNEIKDNKMRNSEFNGLYIDDLTSLQHIILGGNRAENFSAGHPLNASPQEPASPNQGLEYLDDGTNTSSGNPAYRYYDGTAWVDMN